METTKQKLSFVACYLGGGMAGFALFKVVGMDLGLMFIAVLLGCVLGATVWGAVQTFIEKTSDASALDQSNCLPAKNCNTDNVLVFAKRSK